MRKFSAILGIVVSLVLCATGVLMTIAEPLTSLMPSAVPADLTTYAVATAAAPEAQLETFEAAAPSVSVVELPAVDVKTVSVSTVSGSSYTTTNDYLLSYSFGADFYTHMYKAAYKIFNQLVEMSTALSRTSSTVSNLYEVTKQGVHQMNNLADGIELLAQYSAAQTKATQDVVTAQAQTVEALSTVNNNVSALYGAQTAQLTQLNNNAEGMTRIITMLGLLIRAIGVLVTAMGLTNLCKYLAMLSQDKPAKETVEA